MKSVLLIGLGRFGQHVAQKLCDLGHQVMAVDSNEERVDAVLPYVTNAQIGDSTSREFLSSLGIRNFDTCIVAIGDNFQNSLETADPEKQLAVWTAIRCTSEHILDYIELDGDYSIFELSIPEEWRGKTVLQLDLRRKYGINILGLRQDGGLSMSITPDTLLDGDISVLILGQQKEVQRCLRI